VKTRLRLALDHNFPRPIIDVVMKLVPEADLLPLQTFNDGGMLATLPDWKLLVALHRKPDVHGLVSMDEDFKSKPKELVTLRQTRLSAVVVSGVGHDPVRATGLVLHKLPQICGQHTDRRAQLWYLSSGPAQACDITDELDRLARRRDTTSAALLKDNRLSRRQLDAEPLW
jgi:hypothetical protein